MRVITTLDELGNVSHELLREPLSVEQLDDELAHNFGSFCLDNETERRQLAEYIHGLLTE